jgi:hypothetical protein
MGGKFIPPVPSPVKVGDDVVGQLIEFDEDARTGRMMLRGDLTADRFPLMTIGPCKYRDTFLVPKRVKKSPRNAHIEWATRMDLPSLCAYYASLIKGRDESTVAVRRMLTEIGHQMEAKQKRWLALIQGYMWTKGHFTRPQLDRHANILKLGPGEGW